MHTNCCQMHSNAQTSTQNAHHGISVECECMCICDAFCSHHSNRHASVRHITLAHTFCTHSVNYEFLTQHMDYILVLLLLLLLFTSSASVLPATQLYNCVPNSIREFFLETWSDIHVPRRKRHTRFWHRHSIFVAMNSGGICACIFDGQVCRVCCRPYPPRRPHANYANDINSLWCATNTHEHILIHIILTFSHCISAQCYIEVFGVFSHSRDARKFLSAVVTCVLPRISF